MELIQAEKWSSELSEQGILIDVRTPLEYGSARARDAVNLPLDQVTVEKVKSYDKTKVGLICQSGTRAKMAAEKLSDSGLDLYVIEGGTQSWLQAQLPSIQGKKVMSLERQVRIAAGSLVLLGVILSLTVYPGAIYLSGFVGAGLIFAGVTDTCGMGMLIAKMPWNQKTSSCCSTGV